MTNVTVAVEVTLSDDAIRWEDQEVVDVIAAAVEGCSAVETLRPGVCR